MNLDFKPVGSSFDIATALSTQQNTLNILSQEWLLSVYNDFSHNKAEKSRNEIKNNLDISRQVSTLKKTTTLLSL